MCGSRMAPSVPRITAPEPGSVPPTASATDCGGRVAPSYHQKSSVLPAVSEVPGKTNLILASIGQLPCTAPGPYEVISVGRYRFTPRMGVLKMWQPMSPSVPVPKPTRLRQLPG